MTLDEFREQIRQAGLNVRKQKGLEFFDVKHGDIALFSISYARLHTLTDISQLLARYQISSYTSPEKETSTQ